MVDMDDPNHIRPRLTEYMQEFASRPHLGLFFLIALFLVVANTFSLRATPTRFFVLAAELLVIPTMFFLMGSSKRMRLLSYIIPVIGLIITTGGLFLGSELQNLRLFALVQFFLTFFLVSGLVRMLFRKHKINFQTVMGAASLYVLVGLLFARLYYVMDVFRGPFFAAGNRPIVASDFVYYSFTTMTTIGYGDLTAHSEFGRLISVVAAIIGQLYLVVVIALIVGNFSANFVEHEQREEAKKLAKWGEHEKSEEGKK